MSKNLLVYVNGYHFISASTCNNKINKIYGKVTATIRGSYLLHAEEHAVALMNKIE